MTGKNVGGGKDKDSQHNRFSGSSWISHLPAGPFYAIKRVSDKQRISYNFVVELCGSKDPLTARATPHDHKLLAGEADTVLGWFGSWVGKAQYFASTKCANWATPGDATNLNLFCRRNAP
jgi:hypothetical protein